MAPEIIDVDFKPRSGDADDVGLRVKRRDYAACQHAHVMIDEQQRTVTCSDCGEKVDTVFVLLAWARDWERYADRVKSLRDESQRLADRIEELKKVEKRTRARVRRAAQLAGIDAPRWAVEAAIAEEQQAEAGS
jgi:hypothetical protein